MVLQNSDEFCTGDRVVHSNAKGRLLPKSFGHAYKCLTISREEPGLVLWDKPICLLHFIPFTKTAICLAYSFSP